jgi:sugar phosphate isomerase/epimerase
MSRHLPERPTAGALHSTDEALLSRRDLLSAGGVALLAAPLVIARAAAPGPGAADPWRGLKVGVASYTFRELPLEGVIRGIRRVGLRHVSIKDVHLPLRSSREERRAVAQRFRDAGITPLSCGVITLSNEEARVRQAFEYARDLSVPAIVAAPDPASLPLVERFAKEFDIRIAIHNHGPGDRHFPTPDDVWAAVQPLDARVGLCIDVGHTARAGADPAAAIRKCAARLYDLHLKDESHAAPDGAPMECGRGVLDLRAIFQELLEIRYAHHVGVEYEKDASDPLPGLAESVGYVKGLLAGLRPAEAAG